MDLNPIRAGLAEAPEESHFTSVYERITARRACEGKSDSPQVIERPLSATELKEREPSSADAWLCPIGNESPDGRRGILDLTLDEYLELVDWTGRQILANKRGAIPVHLSPILKRLNVDEGRWLTTVRSFGGMFYRAAGRMESMVALARRIGLHWLRGFRIGGKAFSSA